MHPTHHVHISTGFMFACLLFVVAVIAIIAWLFRSKRHAEIGRLQMEQDHEEQMVKIQRGYDDQIAQRVMEDTTQAASSPRVAPSTASPAPLPAVCSGFRAGNAGCHSSAPVVINVGTPRGSDSGFLEGALLGGIAGSMLGEHDHEAIITHEVTLVAPDPFTSSGSDSGASGCGFDYSSGGSYTGGSFDFGGGSDGGGCDF
ncbi:hypothetical protein [Acetobacter sp.]|uniref:hypothetical protein n=1 Tax=Acetobacter sp. TaxID=440 RepID=UPI0039E8B2AA